MKRGKFIVIDGTDGSGKATQCGLALLALEKNKIKVRKIDFPQYENNFFGRLLKECLRGDYGDFLAVPPKIASVLYGADRWESSARIRAWLDEGYIVLGDRYTSSNQIHQGAKITDDLARRDFMRWLSDMEYGVFKIPKPDAIIYLDVPTGVSDKLIKNRGKKDLSELNIKHQRDSRANALKLIAQDNKWIKIDCAVKGKMRTPEKIHQQIMTELNKII